MGTTGTQFFSGISTYSSDFQSIIQRAVSIAQLPAKKLQNEESDNLAKKQALITLNPSVDGLGAAVAALGNLAANQGVSASSSDSTKVSITNTGATSPATYTVSDIQALASAAFETSLAGYSDPAQTQVSNSGQLDLVLGSNTYHLDLTGNNNLNGLRDAINNSGAAVSASILTVGGLSYLSLSATNTGATTLQLNDNPLDLISNTGLGSETSTKTYADTTTVPVSASGHVDLVAGSSTYHLDITASNNLTGLMDAINNAGVPGLSAAISGSAGAFSLTLTASGPTTLQLNDLPASANLITGANQGADADFKVNGIHTTRSANTINDIIPGVSFTLRDTTTNSVTLSLATSPSQLSSALQTFVAGYNKLIDQVGAQIGPSAGPLAGDILIRQISEDIRLLTSYWNSGSSSIHSLSDLGVTFDDTSGHLSFNPNTTTGFSSNQLSDAFKFLGSSNSGFAAMANNFTQLSDPLTGLIRVQEDGYDTANLRLSDQVSILNDRVSQIQSAMTARLQAADALVAQLQSQQNMVNASVSSLNYVLYGKQTNSNGL